ncbi:unnamed protein product [Durusdinium trenchii]|uniref:Uncharacterized protein n=1 Tax=Durusdinium trenchii TaxID=1381693 RepID=A0ABP0SJA5_9DINO
MEQLLSKPNVVYTKADQCQYGLRGESGQPQRKRTGFATNSPEIAKALNTLCPGDHQHEVIIGGKKSKKAQIYPEGLREAILAAYSRSIGAEDDQIKSKEFYLAPHGNYMLKNHEVRMMKETMNRKEMNNQMHHYLWNAAAQAFIEADADNALRRAISSGPRPILDYDIGIEQRHHRKTFLNLLQQKIRENKIMTNFLLKKDQENNQKNTPP